MHLNVSLHVKKKGYPVSLPKKLQGKQIEVTGAHSCQFERANQFAEKGSRRGASSAMHDLFLPSSPTKYSVKVRDEKTDGGGRWSVHHQAPPVSRKIVQSPLGKRTVLAYPAGHRPAGRTIDQLSWLLIGNEKLGTWTRHASDPWRFWPGKAMFNAGTQFQLRAARLYPKQEWNRYTRLTFP